MSGRRKTGNMVTVPAFLLGQSRGSGGTTSEKLRGSLRNSPAATTIIRPELTSNSRETTA